MGKIKARGRDYKIKFVKELESDEGTSLYGSCDTQAKVITLNENQPKEELIDTFLHEYFHAIWYESGLYAEALPSWIEHTFVVNIVHDMLLNKKNIIKLLQLDR